LRFALPALGAALSNDRAANGYLAESMEGFDTRESYEALLAEEGLATFESADLTLGMASIVAAAARELPASRAARPPLEGALR
jgi:ubiquinone/menaquinone biosynthesis C-methylase UbiE